MIPSIRFINFTDAWELRKFGDEIKSVSFKPYLAVPQMYGEYEIIQQGDKPVIGFADGKPYTNPKTVVLFGDHTLSLYKPKTPFFVATDGIKILISINSWDGLYLYYLLEKYKPRSEGYKRYYSILVDSSCFCTLDTEEQKQIGDFFDNFDNLITLYQRKILKLKNVKKAMLGKMFPRKGSNTPEIRFSEFTDAWEQNSFSETFTYLQNNSLSRANLNFEQGIVKNVHYGDVLIKFGEILDVKKAEIPFVSNNEFTVSNTSLLQDGDVIIADAAEDDTVGKCSEIKGVDGISIVSGLHTIPCRPNKTFASGYLGYYLNSSAYHNQLLPLIQGTKISSISKSVLQNTDIFYPNSEEEQFQIGQFFQNLDNLISLYQCKYEKLKNIKRACLEKMFI